MAASRRLAAVMFTDIVGYTSLSQRDETAALRLVEEQGELLRPILAAFHGREVKSTGDGLLIEFDSARDATQCAVEIQQRIHERNAQAGVTPLQLRIGIHLGDVEQRGSDIFGDAVNIASRIEPIAEPEGVCVSAQVFDQIQNKVPFKLEKLAPQTLKGIRVPVDIYRVALPWRSSEPGTPGPTRLAVLPFSNISPDPHDEYFADGLTEELITVLSQLHELRVIARTSVTQYKATSKSISQIGAELGVASVLEGSVRKAGDRLRITVQLIDVGSQEHAWANTYDRQLDDVFAIQAEVAKSIAQVLEIKMRKVEEARLEERPTTHPDSYLAYLKGRSLLHSDWTEKNFREASKQFELALSIDPKNARAHSGLADATTLLGWGHFETSREAWDRARRAHAVRAIELDPGLAEAHCTLASILWDDFDYTGAERELKLALSINPSYFFAHRLYGSLLEDELRTQEALRERVLAQELDPHSALNAQDHAGLLIMLRRFDEAWPMIEKVRELGGSAWAYPTLRGWYYCAQSDFPRALQEVPRLESVESGFGLVNAAIMCAWAGEKDRARKNLEALKEAPRSAASPVFIAMAYGLLGELDECFRRLDGAVADHDAALQIWRCEPVLEPIRKDPRFVRILKTMNLA